MPENQDIKGRVKKEILDRGISISGLSKQTAIPQSRIYKWFGKQDSDIGHEDALILEKWISGKLDSYPSGEPEGKAPHLEQAVLNLTQTELINARNIERLIGLLEMQNEKVMELAEPGTLGTITEIPEEFKKRKPTT